MTLPQGDFRLSSAAKTVPPPDRHGCLEVFVAAIQWYSFRLVTDEEKQLLKVTAEATLKPFGNLLERLFGGAVDQIGGEWEDRLKARRLLRRAKVLAKLKQQLDDAGFEAQQISERVWVPALQAVSLEDDDTLQDTWASLLANAANPDVDPVPPAFPEILGQLTAREVGFLFLLSQRPSFQPPRFKVVGATVQLNASGTMSPDNLLRVWEDIVPGPATPPATEGQEIERRRPIIREFRTSMDNLVRLGIFTAYDELKIPVPGTEGNARAPRMAGTIPYASSRQFVISDLGRAFIAACTKPKSTT